MPQCKRCGHTVFRLDGFCSCKIFRVSVKWWGVTNEPHHAWHAEDAAETYIKNSDNKHTVLQNPIEVIVRDEDDKQTKWVVSCEAKVKYYATKMREKQKPRTDTELAVAILACATAEDIETGHRAADRLLCEHLSRLGYNLAVEEFNNLDKLYS